jgi:lysophospholipid acyltransferase
MPFLVLTFSGSILAWSRVYFYAVIWTMGAMIFFISPGKTVLRKRLEARQGNATAKLVRTLSSDSISGKDPILGISTDPEKDISEAVEELRAEVKARQKKKNA